MMRKRATAGKVSFPVKAKISLLIVVMIMGILFVPGCGLLQGVMGKKTAPEVALVLVKGPEEVKEGRYLYEIKAVVEGDPAPKVTFNRDDSMGEAGKNRATIILNAGESFTLTVVAASSEGKASDSMELQGGKLPADGTAKPTPTPTPKPTATGTAATPTPTAATAAPTATTTPTATATPAATPTPTPTPAPTATSTPTPLPSLLITIFPSFILPSPSPSPTPLPSLLITINPSFIILPSPTPTTVTLSPSSRGSVIKDGTIQSTHNNVGDTNTNLGRQGFITFDVSGIPDTATIQSARLETVTYDKLGDPFGSLGSLRVYVHNYGTLDAGDYTPPPVTGAITRFDNEAQLTDPAVQALNSIGLTGIKNALAGNQFQIRLQFNTRETDNDGVADVLRASFRLVVTYTN